jgi:PAS domain S-box-containing protein
VLFWNKGAQAVYGWKKEEILGKKAAEHIYKQNFSTYEEARRILLQQDEWRGELHQVTKDGKEIIVESHATLMRDQNGKPQSILFVNTDITERKQLERQFLRTQRMESIGTLAGGIAHDLNNVLGPILTAVQIFKKKLPDEQSQKLIGVLESTVQRGADLVRQVLTFSRGVEGARAPLVITQLVLEIEKIGKDTFRAHSNSNQNRQRPLDDHRRCHAALPSVDESLRQRPRCDAQRRPFANRSRKPDR